MEDESIVMKYPINKEFFPYSRMTPPIQNAQIAGWMGSKMKPPRWVRKNLDHEVSITKENIKSYDGATLSVFIIDPYGLEEISPCLVYYHGGGFFFEGAGYHYKLAKQYALACECRVIFVQYRLAPKYPHPTPAEDCYSALRWTFENTDRLKIDKTKIETVAELRYLIYKHTVGDKIEITYIRNGKEETINVIFLNVFYHS